jgi:isopenicillin N synthase-like dioxygenase
VRCIDLSNFEERKSEIADRLWEAAVEIGFFQVSHHGIPLAEIRQAFSMTEAFFALPDEVKGQYPLARNAGWESKAQVRPSTKTPDQKESYQITRPLMAGLWPSDQQLPAFRKTMLEFESRCWQLGMKLLSCFALSWDLRSRFSPPLTIRIVRPTRAHCVCCTTTPASGRSRDVARRRPYGF